jgi:hypothetical protein
MREYVGPEETLRVLHFGGLATLTEDFRCFSQSLQRTAGMTESFTVHYALAIRRYVVASTLKAS